MSRQQRQLIPAALALLAMLITLAVLALSAHADQVSGDKVRIGFHASIRPKALPRTHAIPVSLRVTARVHPLGEKNPAALRELTIQINRHAILNTRGLPRCPLRKLRGATTEEALTNCGSALLGRGYFTSHIEIPEQAPFPAFGRALAFNAARDNHPLLAIHIFGRRPAPIVTVLAAPLRRSGPSNGPFGPSFTVKMPRIGDDWGYVSGFGLTFHRRYRYGGQERSVLRASCPAPPDLRVVPFTAVRGSFALNDGNVLTRTLEDTCIASH